MIVGADDDRPHAPPDGPEPPWDWVESWSFDLSVAHEAHGISGSVRLARRPQRGVGSWTTSLSGHDLGIISVRDDELALPRRPGSLELRGDGLWAELVCETPLEHWGIALEAFGLRLDDPADEVGERLPVGLDLEWETVGPPEDAVVTETSGRYEQPGITRGLVLVGRERYDYVGESRRTHEWGPR